VSFHRTVIKSAILTAVGLLSFWPNQVTAQTWPVCGEADTYPGNSWNLAEAADYGWNPDKLSAAKAVFDSLDSAAVMVVHRGRLIASWGNVTEKFNAQSVRKSLLNSLIGITVDHGLLDINATLKELNISDTKPALTELERRATVRDLMLSRSGIFHSALYEVGSWQRRRAALAIEKAETGSDTYGPGDYWIYNNWDFNALGTIIEQVTDDQIGYLFDTLVASQIEMQDFVPMDVVYTTKDSRTEQHFENWSEHRAYVFNISTRDLARYGLMYMNCGRWMGQHVVPESWVLESIEGVDTNVGLPSNRSDFGFGGWGYLWQVDRDDFRRFENLGVSEPTFMGTGYRGHVMFIMPYLDLVIVHQVATAAGVSFDVQYRRATQGSASVSHEEIQRLFSAIMAAHPKNQ
jgi:CubicO group peptidase (beta-lactamase class C family)